MNEFELNLKETIHSASNQIFLQLRSKIGFQRKGYTEYSSSEEWTNLITKLEDKNSVLKFEKRYALSGLRRKLNLSTYLKCLETLWILEKIQISKSKQILEVGSQDFSRLLAYKAFFGADANITGLEIDPYPILSNFHSRADKAKYYCSLVKQPSDFQFGNFFQCNQPHDCIIVFYPFVSPHPALAWGLPAKLGNPTLWIDSLERNLKPNGQALIVHQGKWEEEVFDDAREKHRSNLKLLSRQELICPFYPLPHPPQASLYCAT